MYIFVLQQKYSYFLLTRNSREADSRKLDNVNVKVRYNRTQHLTKKFPSKLFNFQFLNFQYQLKTYFNLAETKQKEKKNQINKILFKTEK